MPVRSANSIALFLPGAELTLHASVHSGRVAERGQLVGALDLLGPDNVLVLDRGYPAAWLVALVALLNARGIRFVMRCDNDSGWSAAKAFLRSGAADARVTLNAPTADLTFTSSAGAAKWRSNASSIDCTSMPSPA